MRNTVSVKKAKQKAGRFCAFRERSPHEVSDKLKEWGVSPHEVTKIIEELSKEGYLNEQRFANAFCHDKFEFNSWGKQKIKAHIYAHKLPESVIQNALDRINPEQYEKCVYQLAKSKWDKLSQDVPLKKKQKTLAYLSNKGFEVNLIWEAIQKIEQESH